MASPKAAKSGNRKTSSKPASGGKSQTGTRRSKKSTKKNGIDTALQDEIFLLVVIAFAAILILSSFNLAGSFGEIVNGFMFGMVGVVEYVLPIVIVAVIFVIMANRQLAVVRIKSAAAFVLLMLISAFAQKISGRPQISSPAGEFYSYSAQYKSGGGIIGGLICKALSPLGTAGTVVVLLILMIICIVVITERSFISAVRRKGGRALMTAKDDYEYYREHSRDYRQRHEEDIEREDEEYRERTQKKRQERELKAQERREAAKAAQEEAQKKKRTNNKVSGVVLNNELFNPQQTHEMPEQLPDLEEITLEPNNESGMFDIQDEYSKDIFDPSDKHDTQTVSGNDIPGTPASDINEINADIMPRPSQKDEDIHSAKTADAVNGRNDAAAHVNPDRTGRDVKKAQPKQGEPGESKGYRFPPIELLNKNTSRANSNIAQENKKTAMKLQQTLQNFGVRVTITDISCGPSVTRYELQPEQGTKVAKIVSLSDDIKLNLAAADIRIEAPIPGKAAIGIEVPNKETTGVTLRELLESPEFKNHPSSIAFAAGKDIGGKTIVADIAKMPHLLIAGATGSGKSVCINTIIMSILYKAAPDEVKLIMVDPKVVELSVYNGIPHLMIPVVTDPKKASSALNWAVAEMTTRYKKFADFNVRDLKGYNEKLESMEVPEDGVKPDKMPQIVIIIDELADLMMVAPGEVEDAICRLAQLARAAGIHLVIATQRPSVNVITGLIKANVPSRIAFSVSSGVDSRTIIDMNGAEKLLGKGDMLFYPSGYPKPVRVQGAFVSDKEVSAVVDFLKDNCTAPSAYDEEVTNQINTGSVSLNASASDDDRDEYFVEAGKFIIDKEKASIGMLQRYFKIGFNRAARIMDQLCDAGVVGPEEGTKPRKILMKTEEFEEYLKKQQ